MNEETCFTYCLRVVFSYFELFHIHKKQNIIKQYSSIVTITFYLLIYC